jgi:cytochrome P450 family 144
MRAPKALDDIDILDRSLLAQPCRFYSRLRDEAPVWRVPGVDLYLVSSWNYVAEATTRIEDLSNNLTTLVVTGPDGRPSLFDTSVLGPGTTTLATSDPPAHSIHRKAVFPELVAARMALIEPVIRRAVFERLDAARGKPSLEWTSAVANPVPMIAMARVIGFPIEDHALLLPWSFDGTDLLAGTMTLEEMGPLFAAADAGRSYLSARLDDALANPHDDVIGALAHAITVGILTHDEAIGTLIILLGAAGESTASLIGNAVRILAEDAELQAGLRADPTLIPPFVEEVLRLESPFRGHYRQARRDAELGGVTIPAGAAVFLLWAAANRDPNEFDCPDEVVLDRVPARHHMSFGRGIHFCVGAPLARLEANVVLETLLDRTSTFRLVPSQPPAYVNSMFVRRHEQLPLAVQWR